MPSDPPTPPPRKQKITRLTSWNSLGELSREDYRRGYLLGATVLIDHLVNNEEVLEPWTEFSLIYPIMYLHRHCVEISIKDVVSLARSFTGGGKSKPKRLGHSLDDLWNELLGYVDMLQGPDEASKLNSECGAFVGKLHALDPTGDRFRYPLSTAGDAQFQLNIETDILETRRNAFRLCDALSELDSAFHKLIDPDDPDASSRIYFY